MVTGTELARVWPAYGPACHVWRKNHSMRAGKGPDGEMDLVPVRETPYAALGFLSPQNPTLPPELLSLSQNHCPQSGGRTSGLRGWARRDLRKARHPGHMLQEAR